MFSKASSKAHTPFSPPPRGGACAEGRGLAPFYRGSRPQDPRSAWAVDAGFSSHGEGQGATRGTWWWPHSRHSHGGTAHLSTERKAAWEPLDSEQVIWGFRIGVGDGVLRPQSRGPVYSYEVSSRCPRPQAHQGSPPQEHLKLCDSAAPQILSGSP